MPRAKSVLKVAAVLSAILLVSGFILYRVRPHFLNADEQRPDATTFISGTKSVSVVKSTYIIKDVPGLEGETPSTDQSSPSSEKPNSIFLPGSKSPCD